MTKTLDVKKVESALKRAAEAAVNGPKSERAGQLRVAKDPSTGKYVHTPEPTRK